MTRNPTVIDLFAGAGGFGLGFKMASFDHLLSLEVDKWAADTLRANSKHPILEGDIKRFSDPDTIKRVCPVPPDVVIGGPPCQGFSYAAKNRDPNDPRNSMFEYYAKWLKILQPKVFVMENVLGLLSRKNKAGDKMIDIIRKTFADLGYSTELWQLNAAEYGVPQLRQRLFIVGNKYGEGISKPLPTHYINKKGKGLKKAVTVWQAISDLPTISAGGGLERMDYRIKSNNEYQRQMRNGAKYVFNHVAMNHTKRMIERYQAIIEGQALEHLPEELQVRKRNGNGDLSEVVYSLNYRHLKPNSISFTIPASFYSNFIHPSVPRNITSREAARIQSFPDTYIFKGKRTMISSSLLKKLGKEHLNHLSQYNQIGNAVPPLLAKAVAERIKTFLITKGLSDESQS